MLKKAFKSNLFFVLNLIETIFPIGLRQKDRMTEKQKARKTEDIKTERQKDRKTERQKNRNTDSEKL